MHQLKQLLAQRIQSGLGRKSITDASRWACKYRFMGHPYPGLWNFEHHPWLKEMHDTQCVSTVGQKSAQMGFTEWALNKCFFFLDIKQMDVLYVLPNKQPDASDFSSGRFDKALELSEHLRGMFSDTQNIGHKRAGATNMYIRGSNSRSQLKSIPVGLLILDEVDEMTQENIPLAMERLSGQLERYDIKLSTPTIPEYGINYYFEKTTKERFFFPCPSCGKQIELKWPDSVVICGESDADPDVHKSHLKCYECGNALHHAGKIEYLNKGAWVAEHRDRTDRGFYVNQLYSMHLPPSELVKAWFNAKKDQAAEQEFWNSKMGLAHIVAGSKITDVMIEECVGNYDIIDYDRRNFITMGVDVGRKLHVEVDAWDLQGRSGYDINSYARCRVLGHFELDDFEELDRLMFDFQVVFCVIDAQPERRKALEFANRFPGRVRLCLYPVGINGRSLTESAEDEMIVKVDRTSWLDLALGRFKNGTITIPRNTSVEYKDHIKAQVRIPKKDQNGNPVTRYETPGQAQDHYGHARNYAEIALPFACGLGSTQNFSG